MTAVASAAIGHADDRGGWPRRIAVIGAAGTVGSSVANQVALAGLGTELFLIDVRERLAAGHAIDIADAQAVAGVPRPRVAAGAPDDGPVDVVVVAASKPEVPDGDRRDFLAANAGLLAALLPRIEALAGADGLVLVLSNPVDILASWLVRNSAIPADRVLGYSLNDSARFRSAVARVLGVGADRVDGVVLGEHGVDQVPLFSRLRLDGRPLALSAEQRLRVEDDVQGWFRRWSALDTGRSSGWATGAGVRHLIRELADRRTVVATATTAGLHGFPDAFISLPVRRTAGGVQVLRPDADPPELGGLVEAARRIREEADALGPVGAAAGEKLYDTAREE